MACNGIIPGNGVFMNKKRMSGYCHLTVISVVILLALCVTAAGAASLSNSLVVSKVTPTFEVVTTTAPAYASCPTGYDCLTDADATAQLGSFARYSDAVCGYKQNTATLAAVIRTPQYCVKKTEPQYPAICPDGCSCMMEASAKDKFQGVYKQCGDSPCYTVVTGSAQVNAYCFGPGTTTTTPPVTCQQGCDCISEATAKAKGGSWTRCQPDVCGYEQGSTLAAVIQVPKYCMKQESTTPVCPDGCSCLSDANAKAKFGAYTRCGPDVCGYEQSPSLAAVIQVPKYCVKPETTTPAPVCPEGCSCISEADAKLKGLTTRCDPNAAPCGYQSVAGTANTAANRIPLYCYKTGITITPTPQICPEGCYCVQEAEAKAKFGPGNYTRCDPNGKPCGSDASATSANGIPRYCFKPTVTVTPTPSPCPQGCACTTDDVAKIKGLTPCRGTRTSCGYNENKQPQYCFEQIPSPTCIYDYQKNVCAGTCQQGYNCGLLASEKDASGKISYAVCGCTGQPTTPCAYDTTKNVCTGACQTGAACSIVGKKVDEKTGETSVVCGCPQSSSCVYDYGKESCGGTCTTTGDNCQLNTIYRDPTSGKVTYADLHLRSGGWSLHRYMR
jgi:hypothetical protein